MSAPTKRDLRALLWVARLIAAAYTLGLIRESVAW